MLTTLPVMNAACALSKKSTRPAISASSPKRPAGIRARSSSRVTRVVEIGSGHAGREVAGAESRHGDASSAPLEGQRLGHAHDGSLAGVVVEEVELRSQRVNRRVEHDRRRRLRPAQAGPGHQERTDDVHIHHPAEVAHVELGGGEALPVDAGVDKDAVDPAHGVASGIHGICHVAFDRNVAHGGAGQADLLRPRPSRRLAPSRAPRPGRPGTPGTLAHA